MSLSLRLLCAAGVVCTALVTACDYARPFTSVCADRLRPTQVRVTTEPVEYTTDYSLGTEELTSMGSPGPGRVVHGLTSTTLRSNVTLRGVGFSHPITRKHCLRPDIEVALSFTPMTVYVSKDLAPGACKFSMTMQHELQHVGTYRTFLDSIAPEVEQLLRSHFGNRIFYFNSVDEAQQQLNREASERVAPMVEESMKEVRDRQAALDTREEYDRLERACGN